MIMLPSIRFTFWLWGIGLIAAFCSGCTSTHADRGALFGGLLGAGTGAIVGNAAGNTLAGTAIGAGVGALAGSAIGDSLDEMEARNRALIAEQMGRDIPRGQVTYEDVIAMTRANVDEELIINHIRINGMSRIPSSDDIIRLQREGVSVKVIKAMQEAPIRRSEPSDRPIIVREPAPPPVIIYERDPWWWGPPRWYRPYYYHPRPGVSWGITFHN
ncbi:MAG TPA: glycine zipper domain-containing protein [Thermogutta sp.]|nr:glycine zipper domain-containing protein [Thermogutta sp.]HPU07875.1 glycine zipper domain-containing protein [Thermogutta sp.]